MSCRPASPAGAVQPRSLLSELLDGALLSASPLPFQQKPRREQQGFSLSPRPRIWKSPCQREGLGLVPVGGRQPPKHPLSWLGLWRGRSRKWETLRYSLGQLPHPPATPQVSLSSWGNDQYAAKKRKRYYVSELNTTLGTLRKFCALRHNSIWEVRGLAPIFR